MEIKKKFDVKQTLITLWRNRKTLYWFCGAGILLGIISAFTNPKEYSVTTTIVPEQTSSTGLASIASMMGVSLSSVEGGQLDALDPSMFPDIAESVPFLQSMLRSKVHSSVDTTTVTLEEYMKTEYVPWTAKIRDAINGLKDKITGRQPKTFDGGDGTGIQPRYLLLSERDHAKLKGLAKSISVSQNMKTSIITITTTSQDPMVATMMADNVIDCLQESLYLYKSAKSRAQLQDLNALEAERRIEYEKRQKTYADYLNQNRSANNFVITAEKDRLDAEMTLAYQALQQVTQQRYLAEQTILEKKPSYALLAPPTFPLEPNGSRKMIVIVWLFISFIVGAAWILYIRKYLALGKTMWHEIRNSNTQSS